ncbi:unannotated protein [freshwater metagenome]|uniref:Unannotated protein n=1 Tax=freshwater metagenome TaxID=449393 RepID=A0A6J7V247_9ZZZZ
MAALIPVATEKAIDVAAVVVSIRATLTPEVKPAKVLRRPITVAVSVVFHRDAKAPVVSVIVCEARVSAVIPAVFPTLELIVNVVEVADAITAFTKL